MIYGIGTDIVRVARLQAMWEKHGTAALRKLLAPSEIADFTALGLHQPVAANMNTQSKSSSPAGRFLAKRFAAKEALAKALGTGVRPPVLLPNIAICHNELGKPSFAFCAELAPYMQQLGGIAHLSISDEAEFAIAYVILETP